MNYLSLVFYAYIIVFFACYYLLPPKYRYLAIFVGSYIFYGYANARMLMMLIAITVVTYVGGLIIEKVRNKWVLGLFFMTDIMILLWFKYIGFILDNVNFVGSKLSLPQIVYPSIVMPIGLSFIVFQSCTYLTDVYRENIRAERNVIRYGAFVSFFPTVLSGPIQKARCLIPQIKCPKKFDFVQAKKGTILFIWGLFEKIMVADKLAIIVDAIYGDYTKYNSAYLVVAAICYSFYIYADFSSYSDMARGISKIMGIEVGKNFDNPYLSLSLSEFWNRWHTSLNSWFVENLYIPLGGNRNGKVRKYINVMIVFLISGLWHGAYWHYIVWGGLNGVLVVLGQLFSPISTALCSKLRISDKEKRIVFWKRIIVFYCISLTWVFFRNGIKESLYIVKKIICFNPFHFIDLNLLNIGGNAMATIIVIITTGFFCYIQNKRQNEIKIFEEYCNRSLLQQCLPLALAICACVFSVCSTGADIDKQFIYFQF